MTTVEMVERSRKCVVNLLHCACTQGASMPTAVRVSKKAGGWGKPINR
uniref:Uncharacterized protein n=1 Tax=Triticum urartu TaxID=4572 RepID=A0A8R7U5G8_TRIUA